MDRDRIRALMGLGNVTIEELAATATGWSTTRLSRALGGQRPNTAAEVEELRVGLATLIRERVNALLVVLEEIDSSADAGSENLKVHAHTRRKADFSLTYGQDSGQVGASR